MDTRNRAAIITGGASGIGFALATALAEDGMRIMLADIEAPRLTAAADQLKAQGHDVTAQICDVSDEASVTALADAAFARFGTIALLVNNAGIGTAGPLHKLSRANWDWVMAVNLASLHLSARAFVPRLLTQGEPARIANTASEHGLGLPARGGIVTAYTASKHAVIGLSEAMRRDYAGTPISVSVIVPGLVSTDIWNPFRNRQDRFGGPRTLDPPHGAGQMAGLPAAIAGRRIAEGLKADEFYVFTHGRDIEDVHRARKNEIDGAFQRFHDRFGPEA